MKLSDAFALAHKEGRLCNRCGWMITKANWKKGYRQCGGCYSGLKGVNCKQGHAQDAQEIHDRTGEML
jgi:hypothetical protein